MNEFAIWLFKASIAQMVLFALYHSLLRRSTHFKLNRLFLLGIILSTCILPLISMNPAQKAMNGITTFILDEISLGAVNAQVTTGTGSSLLRVFLMLYLAGVVMFLIRFLIQLFTIRRIHRSSTSECLHGRILRVTNEGIGAGSFFTQIYLDRELLQHESASKIIMHEQVHARQLHSLDVILAELCCIVFWFNPAIWQLRTAIKEVHEYLADGQVTTADDDLAGYMQLVATRAISIRPAFLNQFTQSFTLKRLQMMTKNRSGKYSSLRAIAVLPVLAMLILGFSALTPASGLISLSEAAPGQKIASEEPGAVEQDSLKETQPEFPGGSEALIAFMKSHLRYPESARKAGIEGMVYVEFLITATGAVKEVKVRQSLHPEMDAEAIRVVSMMPYWIPGLVKGKAVESKMVLPVNFSLGKK